MAKSELIVTHREATGKGAARSLRRQGLVPGVVYGKGVEATSLSVEPKALEAAIATEAGWNTLITLRGDGPFDGKVVVLKQVDLDPIRREPKHVDFHAIDLNKKVHVMVPVHVIGKSEGEKAGGALQLVRRELECVCLPTAIPSSIDVDVAAMHIGDVLHIDDVTLPEGVDVPHDVNFTVLTVVGIKAEVSEEEAEGEEAEGAEEAEEV